MLNDYSKARPFGSDLAKKRRHEDMKWRQSNLKAGKKTI
jgi:hypothetical protein